MRIDGEPVENELGLPEGFIVIPVPEGQHVVEVEFNRYADRAMAWVITAVSLVLTLLIAWRMKPDALRKTQDAHVSRFMIGLFLLLLWALRPLRHSSATNRLAAL